MEFAHGRTNRFHEQEDQSEVFRDHAAFPSSSSPSSLSITSFSWHDGSSGCGGLSDESFVVKEHMFDKVVTPSDVGKLNRLVIPKMHAEKYLPFDTSANGKGLLLSFEDRTGKLWRFRYSYWNSSQSYVMTKGWSRFVKEKGLDAGDTVSFGRGAGHGARHRLYIDWKRRPEDSNRGPPRIPLPGLTAPGQVVGPWSSQLATFGHNWRDRTCSAASSDGGGGELLYFRLPGARPPQAEVQRVRGSGGGVPMVSRKVPVVCEQENAKRIRLFGVNLDFPESADHGHDRNNSPSANLALLQPRATALPFLQPMSRVAGEAPVSKKLQSTLDLCL
ncbi:hypothetical protein Cni_G15847 [Canna indica]|uniref:TF-B3 domain-containing protein n=1 Tax=Canna indica TaxID=4628 RepID=A0AAQ3QG70_9LILI|nr:hypothetical protein Cni_G15847 [Canna indica]